jgi:hypothetical protein
VGGVDLGRAAAAAARAQDSERPPCAASQGPRSSSDHPVEEVNAQRTSPIGPPDAEQVEAQRARSLLELAGVYTRQALRFPDDVANLQTLVMELLLEVGMLRLDVRRLADRVDRLEGRVGR